MSAIYTKTGDAGLNIVLTLAALYESGGLVFTDQADPCVFRRSWTAIPSQAGHGFQTKLDSRSVATRGFRVLLC